MPRLRPERHYSPFEALHEHQEGYRADYRREGCRGQKGLRQVAILAPGVTAQSSGQVT